MRLAAAVIRARRSWQASLAMDAVVMADHVPKSFPGFSAATLPCPGVPQLPLPPCSLRPPPQHHSPWDGGALDDNIFLMFLKQQPTSQAFPGIAFQ